MAKIPNTIRRSGIYHFRRNVPMALRPVLSRIELLRSLRTTDPKIARSRSARLYLRSEAIFGLAGRSVTMLNENDLQLLVNDFYAHELEDEQRMRVECGVTFDEPNRQAVLSYYDRLQEGLRAALARNELASAQPMVDALLQRHDRGGAYEGADLARLQQAILSASLDVAAGLKARFEGNFTYVPRDPRLRSKEPFDEARPRVRASSVRLSDSPRFVGRAEELREARERRKVWDRQTSLQARATYRLFAEFRGDRPLAAYTREDAVAFDELLSDLPQNYGKAAKYRGKSALAIVEATRDLDVQRLSPRTRQRHFNALSTLWQDALKARQVSENIFAGFKFASTKRAQDQRAMWSSELLGHLLNTPLWRGCQSPDRRSTPGDMVIRDAKFWLPLIALYSGMRLEEICQLQLEDVRREEGIWIFDINARGGRQVKNQSSVRLVPIHRELLKIGFLEHVAEVRRLHSSRVFPELKPGGADGKLGHNFTKWFTRYRKAVGIYEQGLDFHSFRHSATTFLAQAKVPIAVIDCLTGHVSPGETARYNKGFAIEHLKESIDQLSPKVDLTYLHQS